MKKRKKRNTFRKTLGFMLSVAMLASSITFMPGSSIKVQAAATTKNVNLGTGGIGNPTSTGADATAWAGSEVYYADKECYVLDKDGKFTGGNSSVDGNMLLLTKAPLSVSRRFTTNNVDDSDWTVCDIRKDLNDTSLSEANKGFLGTMTSIEQSSISTLSISKSNTTNGGYSSYPSATTNDKIFLLDLVDVNYANYGFGSNETRVPGGWLRSPGDRANYAAYVGGGIVYPIGATGDGAVRPSFNLDPSNVLFTSACGTSKSNFAAVGSDNVSANTWKLTLKDGEIKFAATLPTKGTAGQDITVNITTLGTGTYNQISAILADDDGTVVAYGKIGEDGISDKTFALPSTLSAGNYTLHVFEEQVNSGNLTDYASKEVTGTIAISAAPNIIASTSHSACNHDYEWDVEKAPTETEDGEAVYKCTKCGNISARQPLTAYQYYILTSTNKIKNAKAGSTVTISSKLWNSFPKSFFEQLAKKRDITVKIDFPYDSKNYEITISPTQKIDTSNSKVKYYGPKNLIGTYNAVEVKAK